MTERLRAHATFLAAVWLLVAGCDAPSVAPTDSAAARAPSVPAQPPNVVLFVADDLGWRDLASYGNDFVDTPHLDALVAAGTRFTDAYSNGPNCAPSRASLLTGQDTPRHGITTVAPATRGKTLHRRVLVPETRRALREGSWTLGAAFASAGYRTASIGKWHVGASPTDYGFEQGVGGTQAGHPKSYFSPYRNSALPDGPEGEHLTARLTAEALAFLDDAADEPFFLYLPWFAVHTPIQPREDLLARYRERKGDDDARFPRPAYAAMVTALDESAGAVLAKLDELGLAEETLVVFLSDNGGLGTQTEMKPLRGSKGMLYEGGVRVPLVVRWPGRVPAGQVRHEPVIGTDLAPTLLAAAGLAPPTGHVLDGTSLWPLLDGSPGGVHAERALVWHFPAYLEGNRASGRWRTTPASAIRRGRYKLHEWLEDGALELYDLEEDPGEARDLAAALPEVRDALHAELRAWRAERGADGTLPPNPAFETP